MSDILLSILLMLCCLAFYRMGMGHERDRWERRRVITNDAREIARAKNKENK
tara:strand:+ start:248 stop:403 length:156 start_codon:yes stop_codon:yes gene_type:complete